MGWGTRYAGLARGRQGKWSCCLARASHAYRIAFSARRACRGTPHLPHTYPHAAQSYPFTSHVGTYALILSPRTQYALQIGRLGPLLLHPGFYVYVGSAFGPGGLQARLAHHSVVAARPHWHIDYVRAVAPVREAWYTYDTVRREHHWAAAFQSLGGFSIPLARFGASDCTCAAHFFAAARRPSWAVFRRQMRQAYHEHAPIYRYQYTKASTATNHCHSYGKRPQA